MGPVISGDRIGLRIWRPDDREALALILQRSRDAFGDWLPGAVNDLTDLDAFIERVTRIHRDRSGFFFAIEEDGEVVGQCTIEDRGGGTAEVGYWVRSDRTGRGVATRAVSAVAAAAFADGVRELVIHCDEGNTRSAAVARSGLVHAATVQLDGNLPRTGAQTGREMRWVRRDGAHRETV